MDDAPYNEESRRDLANIYDEYRTLEAVPPIISHYTSLQAMIDICQSGLIRCSNVQFSNDPAEVTYGHELVRDLVAKRFRGPTFDALHSSMTQMDYYAASFSAAPDSLPQWRAYCGNGRGVSIGFASELFQKHEQLVFGRVEYDREKQKQLVDRILDAYEPRIGKVRRATGALARAVADLGQTLVMIAGLLKDSAYSSEHEYRAYVTQPRVRRYQTYPVKFRATAVSVVPYLEFPFATAGISQPVREVVIGPVSILPSPPQVWRRSWIRFLPVRRRCSNDPRSRCAREDGGFIPLADKAGNRPRNRAPSKRWLHHG